MNRFLIVTRSLSKHSLLITSLIVYYIIPYSVFGEIVVHPAHDNLDGEVVTNWISGNFLIGNTKPLEKALAGSLHWYELPRLFFPVNLFYAIFPAALAYWVNDILFRLIAYTGFYVLSRSYRIPHKWASLSSLFFCWITPYSAYGLGLAGFPYLFASINAPRIKHLYRRYSFLLSIGLNTSLPLHGIFIGPMALAALSIQARSTSFRAKFLTQSMKNLAIYYVGLLISNVQLLYGLIWGELGHRVEYDRGLWQTTYSSEHFGSILAKTMIFAEYYHGVIGPAWWFLPLFIASLFGKKTDSNRRPIRLVQMTILSIMIFSILYNSQLLGHLLSPAGSIINTVKIDRFYLFIGFYCSLLLSFALASSKIQVQVFLSIISGITIVFIVTAFQYAFPIQQLASRECSSLVCLQKGLAASPYTFAGYYRTEDYSRIKEIVGDDLVTTVGLDPMIALMNGMATADGYFVVYPLHYKHAFLPFIKEQIKGTRNENYFNSWGNRVYTFSEKDNVKLDWEYGYRILGIRYVISAFPIADSRLVKVGIFREDIHLYRLTLRQEP